MSESTPSPSEPISRPRPSTRALGQEFTVPTGVRGTAMTAEMEDKDANEADRLAKKHSKFSISNSWSEILGDPGAILQNVVHVLFST